MSTSGLAAGLVFLILLLVVSCLVAAFLFLRVRQMASVAYKCSEGVITYESPDFLKLSSLGTIQLAVH